MNLLVSTSFSAKLINIQTKMAVVHELIGLLVYLWPVLKVDTGEFVIQKSE